MSASGTTAKSQSEELINRFVHGTGVVFGATIGARGIAFVSTIVLARVLAPSDFGLVSMSLVVLQLAGLFLDKPLPQALVQSADFKRAASTTFVLMPIVAFTILLAVVLTSPLVAVFFGQPRLPGLIVLLTVAYGVGTFGHVPMAVLERQLNYGRRAIPEILAPLSQAVASIGLALGSRGALGVWALAWGYGAYWLTWAGSAWLLANWPPSIRIEARVARDLLLFGRDVLGVEVLVLVAQIVDKVAVGKLLGPTQLGFYAMAFNMAQLPTVVLSVTIARVSFPIFARLRSLDLELQQVYRSATKFVAVAAFPMTTLLVALAPDFIPLAFGRRWQGAIRPLQILAIAGLAMVLVTLTASLLTATGRRKRCYPIALVALGTLAVLILPAARLDITAVSAAVCLSVLAAFSLSQVIAVRTLASSYAVQLAPLVRPMICSAACAALSWAVFHSLIGRLGFGLQVLMATSIVLTYSATLLLIDRELAGAIRLLRRSRTMTAETSQDREDIAGLARVN